MNAEWGCIDQAGLGLIIEKVKSFLLTFVAKDTQVFNLAQSILYGQLPARRPGKKKKIKKGRKEKVKSISVFTRDGGKEQISEWSFILLNDSN